MDELEREAFRRAAAREGLSLSDWLRRAARDRLEAARPAMLASLEDLRAFFEACDAREEGTEPDWTQHRTVIEESKASGRTAT
ncbi:MAG: antitoxin [Deltaproteobacteria bacterium]|nr:antitoxin [Deltaproteobacteria bacterium]